MTDEDQTGHQKNRKRDFGSMPWLKALERKRFRAKVFKSGNSLALRLPAGLGLQPGMEMNLEVENGTFFSFEAVGQPKRKFDIDSIWGIEPGLERILPEDRLFDERSAFVAFDPTGPTESDA